MTTLAEAPIRPFVSLSLARTFREEPLWIFARLAAVVEQSDLARIPAPLADAPVIQRIEEDAERWDGLS